MDKEPWKTVGVKLTQTEYSNFQKFLKIEATRAGLSDLSANKFMRDYILEHLEAVSGQRQVAPGSGLPPFGENVFEYNADADNFSWILQIGSKKETLMEDVSVEFLFSLKNDIERALSERDKALAQTKGTRLPKNIRKYAVKKYA